MQGFVALWERALGKFKGRWTALFSLFGLAYLAIDLLSTKTPFHVFVNYLTFSKQSAYNRILISAILIRIFSFPFQIDCSGSVPQSF